MYMQTTNAQGNDAFGEHRILNTDILRYKSDKQSTQGLHTKESHSVNTDHPSPHGRINSRLYQCIADGNLAHHSKSCNSREHERQRINGHMRKQTQADSEYK